MSDDSDSDGDDDDPTQHPVVAAGGEPALLLASLIGSTTVANGVTWTIIGDVTDSTTVGSTTCRIVCESRVEEWTPGER